MNLKIYHNPRCRKSRETLALLEEKGQSPEIVLYLETTPSAEELKSVIKKLEITAFELIRKSESIFKEQYKGMKKTDDEWIQVMLKYPKLIERPIVIKGKKAVIGRPPENALALI